ncbi:MAG: hypothetical protein QXZ70_05775 [Candidatus Bathyarchaeia archaeon]
MFDRIKRKKKEKSVIINIFFDNETYNKFKDYVAKNGYDESSALINILERGLANYWLYWFMQQKQNSYVMREIFEEYKKDNETLEAIENQNEQLKKILDEKIANQMALCNRQTR